MRKMIAAFAAAAAIAIPASLHSNDLSMVNRIMDEGFNRSQVMTTAEYLSDQIGPRLTNSPNMRKAEAWTSSKFSEWGLTNVHKEGFEFGRGWWIESSSVRMTSPRPIQLTAIPIAWTPATNGTVSGEVIVAPIATPADFAKWKGKLKGKIVLVTKPDDGSEPGDAPFKRYTAEDLAKLDQFVQPKYDPAAADRGMKRLEFAKKLDAFLQEEGAVAYATKSRLDGKLVHARAICSAPAIRRRRLASRSRRRIIAAWSAYRSPAQIRPCRSTATSVSTIAMSTRTTSSPTSPAGPRTAAM